ncbi:hypothetical protein IWW50_004938 [Coemansia erecta]|nr:hypothetical protein GGF43_003634 [Coemansia sp. RSA 2618]KAJ2820728.1 hypothetical protein IWW50_004938 [Coemansia erecta]
MADSQAQSADEAPTQPVVLITRVGSWIGAEAAVHFRKRGVTVIGVSSTPKRSSELACAIAKLSQNPGKFILCVGALTNPQIQDQIVEHILTEGQLAGFVHNVGAYEHPVTQASEPAGQTATPIEHWEALQRSLLEALPLVHRLRTVMRRCKCRIVHVASEDVLGGLPQNVALVAIKTAVNILTAEMAIIEPSITSLAVHPRVKLPFGSAPASTLESSLSSVDQLQPAGELIADLTLSAVHSMSGQFFMYSEPDFLKTV